MILGMHRSAEIQQWIEEGFMHAVLPEPKQMRSHRPWIRALADSDTTIERELHAPGSRLPTMGFDAIRRALDANRPVLVHVPRRGYAPSISCSNCRAPRVAASAMHHLSCRAPPKMAYHNLHVAAGAGLPQAFFTAPNVGTAACG